MYNLLMCIFFIPCFLWAREINNPKNLQSGIKTNERNNHIILTSPDYTNDFIIELGGGFRYWRGDAIPGDNSSKVVYNIGIGKYFDNEGRSVLGLEYWGYRTPANAGLLPDDKNSYVIDIYYRRNFRLFENIDLYPQIGFSPYFAHDPVISISLSAGVDYWLNNFGFFAKNSIRFDFSPPRSSICFFSIGLSIKL